MGGVDFAEAGEARRALPASTRSAGLPRLGWVGRLSHEKGADIFIEALAILDRSGYELEVSIIGDGPARFPLQGRTTAFRSVEVGWHGAVPNAARLFPAFDLFVLSSRTEGTPIVLLEAMAAGVPIVATAVGGVPDVTGRDGAALVHSEDPRALADAIRADLADPDAARRRVAAATRRLDREFAAEPWHDRHQALYTAVVSESLRTSSPSS